MNRIKDFLTFINEAEVTSKSIGTAGARFQFPLGKYKVEDISPDDLSKLRENIARDILAKLKEGNAYSGPTEINLVASTSTINVTPALRKQLSGEGFPEKSGDKTGNYALCQARLKTISDLMFGMLQIDPNNKEQMDQFQKIYTVKKTPLPDQSADEKSQYIESTIKYTGQKIKDQINCDAPLQLSGKQANQAENFVGYANDSVALVASPNTKVTFKFRPGNIPDCLFWYQNPTSYGLTPFLGNKQSREKSGDSEFRGKVNALGTYKEKGNFEKRLNSQKDALINAMKAEISKFVDAGTAEKLINSVVLDKDGNISVIEEDPKNTKLYNVDVVKSPYTKDVKVRAFSPLSDTEFGIATLCSLPQIDTATGKISGYTPYQSKQG
jgi:hypothetical protein